jgi:hypothetical protein
MCHKKDKLHPFGYYNTHYSNDKVYCEYIFPKELYVKAMKTSHIDQIISKNIYYDINRILIQ